MTSCDGHVDGVKTEVHTSSLNTSQNHPRLLKHGTDAYVQLLMNVKNLIAWASHPFSYEVNPSSYSFGGYKLTFDKCCHKNLSKVFTEMI